MFGRFIANINFMAGSFDNKVYSVVVSYFIGICNQGRSTQVERNIQNQFKKIVSPPTPSPLLCVDMFDMMCLNMCLNNCVHFCVLTYL